MSGGYDYDLLCVGSGPGGQRAAVQAAKLGKRVAVIEKRRRVGGVCLEVGTIPSKTFREAVRAFGSQHRADDGFGFAPRSKPSIEQLLSRVEDVIQRETEVLADQMQRNDVNIIFGTASFRDPHRILVEAEQEKRVLSCEYILLAPGTRAAEPPGVKPNGETVIVSDGLMDLKQLPRTLVVVGAGVIGIEYASMFAALGVEVTVIDLRARPLEFLDDEIVDELIHQLRNTHVTFRLGEKVERIGLSDGPKPEGLIVLESGKVLVADLVLFSAGRQGATETLNLSAAGLEADRRGRLSVDEVFRTPVPHIYAVGDVIGFPALASTSSEQGRLAACDMFGVEGGSIGQHLPFGIYSIPEISMVGVTEKELTEKKVPYEVGIARYREIARGQILGDDSGLLKLIFHREDGSLLGVHVIGSGATELVHIGQAVMGLGGGLQYFLNTVFNYPTLAECYKVAALDAANKLRRVQQLSIAGA